MTASDAVRWNAIDRPLGWLIALGGCILVLDQTVFHLDQVVAMAWWWNVGALLVTGAFVGMAIAGMVLPLPVLAVLWRVIPPVYVLLQATWILGFRGADLGAAAPWLWTLEPAVITLLLLTVRPGIAVVTCLAISLVPAASGLILLGHVPEGVATYTPYELGNVVYLAIFVGVRIQLEHLHASEREEHAQRVRQMRVSAQLEQHAAMSRLVHDEVLASLFAAMHTDGAPSSLQSRDARRVIAELDAATEPGSVPGRFCSGDEAAEAIRVDLRRIDATFDFHATTSAGRIDGRVVRGVTLAAAEALRNSVRHAGDAASRWVRVSVTGTAILVSVRDNGTGFDPSQASSRLGIRHSIVERMAALGGAARIESERGCGTEVILTWPI